METIWLIVTAAMLLVGLYCVLSMRNALNGYTRKGDKLYCKCGKEMIPDERSHCIVYNCKDTRFYNAQKHSFPPLFIKDQYI